MASHFCDSKSGSDSNGGTSLADAVQTVAKLGTLGAVDDFYYLLGHGEDYPYNLATDAPGENRHWRGIKNGGALWRPPWTGWPLLIAAGSQDYDGPPNPYSVKDMMFRNFDQGVDNLRDNASEAVVERCVFDSCDDGIWLGNESDLIARYNLIFGASCYSGIYVRNTSAITGIEVHHNTLYGCENGIFCIQAAGNATTFAAIHSNAMVNCTTGLLFNADGSYAFDVGTEPDYNLYHNNGTDLNDNGQGISKGTNKVEADPLFRATADDDYRLGTGSPGLSAAKDGENIGGWDEDFGIHRIVILDASGNRLSGADVELKGDDNTAYYQTDFYGGSDPDSDVNGEIGMIRVNLTNSPFTLRLHKYGRVDETKIFPNALEFLHGNRNMRTYPWNVLSEAAAIALTV